MYLRIEGCLAKSRKLARGDSFLPRLVIKRIELRLEAHLLSLKGADPHLNRFPFIPSVHLYPARVGGRLTGFEIPQIRNLFIQVHDLL